MAKILVVDDEIKIREIIPSGIWQDSETGADSSRTCCEEVRQVAAVLSEGISALVPELLVLSVLAFLFQHQGIQFF